MGHVIICTSGDKEKEGRLGVQLCWNAAHPGVWRGYGQPYPGIPPMPPQCGEAPLPEETPPQSPSHPPLHSEAARPGIRATLSGGFPLTDWQAQRVLKITLLPFQLTVPRAGTCSGYQNVVQVPQHEGRLSKRQLYTGTLRQGLLWSCHRNSGSSSKSPHCPRAPVAPALPSLGQPRGSPEPPRHR